MARHYYGCNSVDKGWEQYFELCNAFEFDPGSYEEPPTIETLNGWRVDSPRNFCFILHAAHRVKRHFAGGARVDAQPEEIPDVVERGWETTRERADALAATAVLLPTPSEFRPSEANRQKLRAFSEQVVGDDDPLVLWEPSGIWTLEQMRDFSEELGFAPVYNPFIADREDAGFRYGDAGFVVTERAARRRQFDVFDFEKMIGWTQNYDRLFTMFRGRHKWAHAQNMQVALRRAEQKSS